MGMDQGNIHSIISGENRTLTIPWIFSNQGKQDLRFKRYNVTGSICENPCAADPHQANSFAIIVIILYPKNWCGENYKNCCSRTKKLAKVFSAQILGCSRG
jgi:hypothetical protein